MIRPLLFTVLLCMFGTKSQAYDIAVENADGVKLYYNYINDGKELEVTHNGNARSYTGSVIIPEEVTYMNRTRKVTSIGRKAFLSCIRLTSVTIPNSVTSIGDEAFMECLGLTSVTIPNSVTSIGDAAFMDCIVLTSVAIGNSVTRIGNEAFLRCNSLTSVTIPNSVTSIGDAAFMDCIDLTSVTIPNSVTSIGSWAFSSCLDLTSVTIPNSVTSIGNAAFYGCSGLTSVTIPNSVTSIGDKVFYGCSGLTSVTIPNSVTSIGDAAFMDCIVLTSVAIGNSVTRIGNEAFLRCNSLTSVTIPNSVTSIGDAAFYGWDLPEVISKIENPFKITGKSDNNYRTFSLNTFNNATLYVPIGTIEKYKSTEGWKDFVFIEEGNGIGNTPLNPTKCEKPTISYQNGKLTFNCSTEGATYQYSITDSDIRTGNAKEIQLGVTYNISVYASKAGYEDSEKATATLCWIDVDPKTEGITNSVSNVRANAVLIQSDGNVLNISGVPEGSEIIVYNLSGQKVGSARATCDVTNINTTLDSGEIGIVKIGDKSVKVIIR